MKIKKNKIEDISNLFIKISIDKLQEENKPIGQNNSISNNLLEFVKNSTKI